MTRPHNGQALSPRPPLSNCLPNCQRRRETSRLIYEQMQMRHQMLKIVSGRTKALITRLTKVCTPATMLFDRKFPLTRACSERCSQSSADGSSLGISILNMVPCAMMMKTSAISCGLTEGDIESPFESP